MWLNQLKIAVVLQDMALLNTLLDDIPAFDNAEDIESAQILLQEASQIFEKLKDDTSISMKKMKQNIDFLKSTEPPKTNKFDIKS